MPSTGNELTDATSQKVLSALVNLLETKSLYQSATVSIDGLNEIIEKSAEQHKQEIKRAGPNANPRSLSPSESAAAITEILKRKLAGLLYSDWDFYPETNPPPGAQPIGSNGLPYLPLPSIRVSCSSKRCKGMVQPHNSGFAGLRYATAPFDFQQNDSALQIFCFPYQCQNCKEEPLIFLVKRDGLKLTLVGRSQFPETLVLGFIPEPQRKFYRNSIIADQTSFTLAAALYLRTVVEQFFYSAIPSEQIKAIDGNPTGDELGDLYAQTLPKDFPNNFPSLKKAYSDLSAIVHSGLENDDVKKNFLTIRNNVDGHFKAIQLFKEMQNLK